MRKITAALLTLSMMGTMVPASLVLAKPVVTKKVTLKTGQSTTIKVKKLKKSQKITKVSASNKKVKAKKLSKNKFKITGKKKGKATVKVKIKGAGTIKVKVTVKKYKPKTTIITVPDNGGGITPDPIITPGGGSTNGGTNGGNNGGSENSGGNSGNSGQLGNVSWSQSSVRLNKGESTTLSLQNLPSNVTFSTGYSGTKGAFTITKKDRSTYMITGTGKGTGEIHATVNGKTYSVSITVVDPQTPTLNTTSLSLKKGQTSEVILSHAYDGVKASIDDSSVAKLGNIQSSGSDTYKIPITGVDGGSATLTVNVGSTKLVCKITVEGTSSPETPDTPSTPENPSIPSLNVSNQVLKKGESFDLKVSGLTDGIKVTNSSSATVKLGDIQRTGEGTRTISITALKRGTATITVSTGNTDLVCKIIVEDDAISTWDKTSISLQKGESQTVVFQNPPADYTVGYTGTKGAFTIEKKNETTYLVMGTGEGSGELYATSGESRYAVSIQVSDPDKKVPSLDATSKTVKKGEKFYLKVLDPEGSMTAKSSNSSVADVEGFEEQSDGSYLIPVEAKSKGNATIFVSVDKTDLSCQVTVEDETASESSDNTGDSEETIVPHWDKTELTIDKGQTATLHFTLPKSTTYSVSSKRSANSFSYTHENGSDAYVITALGEGEGTITVTVDGKEYTTTIHVTDTNKPSPSLSETEKSVAIGESFSLKVLNAKNISAQIDRADIAQIGDIGDDDSIPIKGLKNGTATITVTADDTVLTCKISVGTGVEDSDSEKAVNFDSSTNTLTIKKGMSTNLAVSNGANVSAKSEDESIASATVNEKSEIAITAKSTGTTKVNANIGGAQFPITVIVTE